MIKGMIRIAYKVLETLVHKHIINCLETVFTDLLPGRWRRGVTKVLAGLLLWHSLSVCPCHLRLAMSSVGVLRHQVPPALSQGTPLPVWAFAPWGHIPGGLLLLWPRHQFDG